jgi:ATP-dependent helicase/nuclease subunit B
MGRADLVICGGLTEGVWPGSPKPDPLLPPAVLRQLGVPAPISASALPRMTLPPASARPRLC